MPERNNGTVRANIAEILREQARERPATAAIIERVSSRLPFGWRRDRALTFAQLDHAAGQAATLLHANGVRAGDAVLLLAPMSAELYAALLGLFRLGATAMFLDPSAGRDHVARCCARVPPAAFLGSPRAHLLRLRCPALRRVPRHFVLGGRLPGFATPFSRADQLEPSGEIAPCAADAPALLTFTSGSTGEPKAAVRTHSFLRAQGAALARGIALAPGEVDLATLPIFVLANLASGVTSVLPDADLRRPGAVKAAPVLAQMRRCSVHRAAGSPALFERLLEHAEGRPHAESALTQLRAIYTGGAPVFPDLLARLQRAAPNARVVAVYGSTEAEPIAHVAHDEISAADLALTRAGRGLLAGAPVPEIALRILPDRWGKPLPAMSETELQALTLPGNEVGEIVVHGAHVLSSYLDGRGDEETKFTVRGNDGDARWHRTGDAGWLDARGRLWLLGRCAARVGGGNGGDAAIYPFSVECAARDFPFVARAAFIEHRGRRLLAVEPNSGSASPGERELAALRQTLAWARLDEVRLLPRLPVDARHNAKIDYPRLRALLGAAG